MDTIKKYWAGLWQWVGVKFFVDLLLGATILVPAYLILKFIAWISPECSRSLIEIGISLVLELACLYILA